MLLPLKQSRVIEMPDKVTYEHKIIITLSDGDFIESMGREPLDQSEFDRWAELAEKGLLNGHIDWNIIYECTKDAMPTGDEK